MVFGGPGVGGSEDILLSSLNGTNGFKLDGENNKDYSGGSVSAAGDINGDGYADLLIGAPYYPVVSAKGRSYVVFGGPGMGGSGDILLSSLNGTNGFKLDGENNGDMSGISVSAAGDINGDGVADILVGAYGYPKGNHTGRSYVIFGDVPPVLVNNTLTLYIGETLPLTSNYLAAYDRNHDNATLVFIPGNISHGYFSALSAPTTPLVNFIQSQITNGSIQFMHDGSVFPPGYEITVRSEGIAWTGPAPANISFTVPLMIVNNQLTLSNGQTVVLSLNNLQAVESGVTNNSQLIFSVGNVQNGYFSIVPVGHSPAKNLTSFTQAQIQNGDIEFVHSGDKQAPSYLVLASCQFAP